MRGATIKKMNKIKTLSLFCGIERSSNHECKGYGPHGYVIYTLKMDARNSLRNINTCLRR